jgi:hypothetical protein
MIVSCHFDQQLSRSLSHKITYLLNHQTRVWDKANSHPQHDAVLDYYGRRLATCSSDRTIKIFEVEGETHRLTETLKGQVSSPSLGDLPSTSLTPNPSNSPIATKAPSGQSPGHTPNTATSSPPPGTTAKSSSGAKAQAPNGRKYLISRCTPHL